MRKQRRKQILCFITVILLIILVSMLLPYGIRAVSNIFMDYIAKEAETETVREPETGNTSVLVSGSENAKGNNAPVTELENLPAETDTEILSKETDTRSQEKAEYDAGLKQYRGSVDPEYMETYAGSIEDFINGRQKQFGDALADYLYGLYDDSYTVDRVNIIEKVREDASELSYQIEVFVTSGEQEYSEQFICSYNKNWDFYSFYNYQQP